MSQQTETCICLREGSVAVSSDHPPARLYKRLTVSTPAGGITWNHLESPGISWNHLDSPGISRTHLSSASVIDRLMIPLAAMFILRCLRLILNDVWTRSCLHHFLLEFLGTALFLCASLSAVLIRPGLDLRSEGNLSKLCNHSHLLPHLPASPASHLHVALVFGLSVAMAAVCVGGNVHLNPAVTVAMALTLRLRLWRAALYVIGQLLGGVVSAALLLGLTGDATLALNQVAPGVQLHLAVTVETLVTLHLVMVVLATVDAQLPSVASNLLVGLAVSLGHLVAVSVTGCGMNPARSFGPAFVLLDFNNHWVFWAGPLLGACLAALLNDLLLRPRWGCPGDWWAGLKKLYMLTDRQQQEALSQSP